MNQELDYAEMLEIPVSTVNVVKKKSLFRRKNNEKTQSQDDLKDMVVDSVNERVGAYVYAEDLSDIPQEVPMNTVKGKKDKGGVVLICELAAVCAIAFAIFLTNLFMPTSVINTFINSFTTETKKEAEPTYSEFTLSSVVSEFSDAVVTVSDIGVLSFTAECSVYPICSGKVASISEENGVYTVQIAHTSTFTSVVTGLKDVYSAKGTAVASNIPFAYSDGNHEVSISMYDGDTLLNCYSLSGEVPVWNS